MQWAFGSAGAGHAFFEAGRLDGRGLVELEAYRVQAEKVYLEEQAKDVISKVRHTVAKRLFDCTPGRWVMYFRRAKGRGAGEQSHGQKLGSWLGPARILMTEPVQDWSQQSEELISQKISVVWVSHGNRLLRCHPSQLRNCSERELAVGMLLCW